jgi:beta-galactosidase
MNKISFFAFLLAVTLLVSCSQKHTEEKASRQILSLNHGWKFAIDSMSEGEKNMWAETGVPAGRWVNLPHTWNTDTLYEDYRGLAWYEKVFDVPEEWQPKSLRLSFERVYHAAIIWINGQLVHSRHGAGYTGFTIDISEQLVAGRENKLVVCVDNRPSPLAIPYMNSFDWAMDGGIIGDVDLIISDRPSVRNVLAHSSYTRSGKGIQGNVTLQIILDQEKNSNPSVSAFRIMIQKDNQSSSDIVFNSVEKPRFDNRGYYLDISLPDVRLWHFDDPNLYKIEVEPIVDGHATDRFTTTMGFRKFEVKDGGIFLNDEEVRLVGVEWMPGSNPEFGFAEPEAYIRKVLSDMKDLNAVFTRFHWQQSPKVIDLCNRLGILVQEEIPLWQQPVDFSQPPLSDLANKHAREMIFRDFNAPAIIAWGIGNELSSLNEKTIESLLMLKEYVEKLDSTRVVSYVSNHIGEDPATEVSRFFDWIMMNDYYGTWFSGGNQAIGPVLDQIHHLYPDKPVIIAEWGLCEECNPDYDQGGGDDRRIRDMIEHYEQYITRPWVKGYIYFSYNDYRTHMGIHETGRYRQRIHGVVDLDLNPKPSWKHLKTISAPLEFIQQTTDNKNITLAFRNKATLPAYPLRDYKALVTSLSFDQIIISRQLETLQPGDITHIEMAALEKGRYRLSVLRPTGFHAIDHEFEIK